MRSFSPTSVLRYYSHAFSLLSPRMHGLADWLKNNTPTIKLSLFIFHFGKKFYLPLDHTTSLDMLQYTVWYVGKV